MFVYLMASRKDGTLYLGVTRDLVRRDIKKWRREWKVRLIEEENPDWRDLYPDICR